MEICRSYDVTVLCDEVYRPLYHESHADSIVSFEWEKSASTSSMSKAFSLAGLRLGWIVTKNQNIKDQLYEKRDYNTISVLKIDDMFATAALKNVDKILQRSHELCASNLAVIERYINSLDGLLEWVKPKGGSTCFVKVNKDVSTMKMAEDLAENYKLLVVPGEVFSSPGFLRIGFGNAALDIEKGFEVLIAWLKRH